MAAIVFVVARIGPFLPKQAHFHPPRHLPLILGFSARHPRPSHPGQIDRRRDLMTIGKHDFSTTILHVRSSPDSTSAAASLRTPIKGASTTANFVDASCSEGQYFRNCLVHRSSSSSWRHPAQQTATLPPPSKISRDGTSTRSTLRELFPSTAYCRCSQLIPGQRTIPWQEDPAN